MYPTRYWSSAVTQAGIVSNSWSLTGEMCNIQINNIFFQFMKCSINVIKIVTQVGLYCSEYFFMPSTFFYFTQNYTILFIMLSHLFLSTNHDTINFFPSFYIIKTTPQSIIAQKYFMQLFKKYHLFVKFRLVLSSPYYVSL